MSESNKNEIYEDVQKRLVASIIAEPGDSLIDIIDKVSPDDFRNPKYQLIFQTIHDLTDESYDVSVITVAQRLEAEGNLEKAGGVSSLYTLKNEGMKFLLEAPVDLYARTVRELSSKFQLREILLESMKDLRPDSGTTSVEIISSLQNFITDTLQNLSDSSTLSTTKDFADELYDVLEERKRVREENAEYAEGLQGIPSLLPSLNEYTTGWNGGELITVAAQTTMGKTVFAINCAVAAAQAGKRVLFHSIEMGKPEIENRILACISGIPLNQIKQGEIEDHEALKKARQELSEMNIVIDVEEELTVESISARAMKLSQEPGGLDMVIVDYIQLLTPSRKTNNREQEVSDFSRSMKLIAKKFNVPVMAVAQLNRPPNDQDPDAIPNIYQIRESAAIANNSNIVILLHRVSTGDETIAPTKIILAKNRNGVRDKIIMCHSDLGCSAFREMRKTNPERISDDDLEELEDNYDPLNENLYEDDPLDYDEEDL